jgi:tetratricopeptide (TPR) repeat protein
MVALWVVAGSAAWATGYDDFLRGTGANRTGHYDLAASAFTAALKGGDLAPVYIPQAHIGRAYALLHQRQCAEALGDLDAALASRPGLLEALTLRSNANSCLGHRAAALADINAAIAIRPTTQFYVVRGDIQWFGGLFSEAAADYLTAAKAQPRNAFDPRDGVYALLWYAISARRAQHFDVAAFAALARNLDSDTWPGPLLDLVSGSKTAEQILRIAAEGEAAQIQKCEADFFIAEWLIAGGDLSAKARLAAMVQACPHSNVVEFAAADLERLP